MNVTAMIVMRVKFNFSIVWRKRREHSLAVRDRLARQRAFITIVNHLSRYDGGLAFMVDTTPLKESTPHIRVTERWHYDSLKYSKKVSAIADYHGRRVVIKYIKNQLTYMIF